MTERQKLIQEATELGLTFAKNAKTTTIQKAVDLAKEEAIAEEAFEEVGGEVEEKAAPVTEAEMRKQLEAEFAAKLAEEKAKIVANAELNIKMQSDDTMGNRATIGQAKLKARRDAMKLVRVNVTSRDPMKSSWDGEILSAGNDVIGEVKKYIPFNTEEGYHIPQILVNVLKEKKCTVFVNRKGADGKMLKEAKQVSAYNIETLEPLTPDELTELARSQTDRGAID